MKSSWKHLLLGAWSALLAAGCSVSESADRQESEPGSLIVYSGRNEKLIGPLVERFRKESGLNVQVRYGDTAELAATILEEGKNSPADIFFAQDAGALGALALEERLRSLPESTLAKVPSRFRSAQGVWVGISGRARVVAYNPDKVKESDLPASIQGFTDPRWKNRMGWAPTNGSFQSFVTALRKLQGDQATEKWLRGIQANRPRVYSNNSTALRAVAAGEVDVAFVNHYYLFQVQKQSGEPLKARNYYPKNGDPGALINVAGVGILDTAANSENALQFLDFLLRQESQRYFAESTFEYPLVEGVSAHSYLTPLSEIQTPLLDLGDLADLKGTLALLQKAEVLN